MKRHGLTLELLAFLLVAIIAVSSVAALAVLASGTGKLSVQQSSQTSVSSTSAKDGLRLSLEASPSGTPTGSGVGVSLTDFNTLPTTNSPAITGMPTVGGETLSLGPCSQLPLGFAIYQGNYQADNLSQALPLNLFQPGIYNCPALFDVAYYSFSPMSDNITLFSPQSSEPGSSTVPTPMWTAPDSFNQSFTGYWTGGSAAKSGNFQAFASGIYTLVGGDGYGQLTILHFSIPFIGTTVTTTTGQSSSSVSTTAGQQGGQNASAASQLGLKLFVNMNATEILPGQTVEVNLTEFNTLARVNNVSTSSDYPVQVALGSCENEYVQPFGIAVYSGHVDAQNLSQGQQVSIFPITACPMFIRLVTGYEFQPQSNLAVVLPESGATPSPLLGSVAIRASYPGLPQTEPLAPGSYTIVAADEWGALAFLYFLVK
jgi:hypothetical protein